MSEPITFELGDDPFSQQLLQHLRDVGERFARLAAGEPQPYVDYILRREGLAALPPGDFLAYKIALFRSLERGFDPERYREYAGHHPTWVQVAANGHFRVCDGTHRLAVAAWLDRPVVVQQVTRHPRWLEKLNRLYYQPYAHPDFSERTPLRTDEQRYQLIYGQTVLEIGANVGHGSRILKSMGNLVTACDADPCYGEMLADHPDHVTAVQCDLHTMLPSDFYVATVGMSVWHHLARDLDSLRQLVAQLSHIPLHFIELPGNHAVQWSAKFREETGGQCVEAVLAAFAGYTSQVIYTDHAYDGRQTWRLRRDV